MYEIELKITKPEGTFASLSGMLVTKCITRPRDCQVWDARKPSSRPTQEYKSGGENFTIDYSPDGHYIAMGYVCFVHTLPCDRFLPLCETAVLSI